MQREAFRNFLTSATLGHFFNRRGAEFRKVVLEFFLLSSFESLRFDFLTAEVQRVAKLFFDLFLFEVLLL